MILVRFTLQLERRERHERLLARRKPRRARRIERRDLPRARQKDPRSGHRGVEKRDNTDHCGDGTRTVSNSENDRDDGWLAGPLEALDGLDDAGPLENVHAMTLEGS